VNVHNLSLPATLANLLDNIVSADFRAVAISGNGKFSPFQFVRNL
jgi:hypothetical protein